MENKIYTNILQSKTLAEILPLESAELVRLEEDAKSKRAVVVAADKARDATTDIGYQFSNSQQVRLAMLAIEKVINEINEQ